MSMAMDDSIKRKTALVIGPMSGRPLMRKLGN